MRELIKHNLDNARLEPHYIPLATIIRLYLPDRRSCRRCLFTFNTAKYYDMIDRHNRDEIRQILKETKTIAVIGCSPKEERPSHGVARYLIEVGYRVIPVNPGHEEILGQRCYPSLLDVPEDVDIADIFRRSEEVEPIVMQALEKDCKTIWMQQGIINHLAAEIARQRGKKVIMDRCIKVDHANLIANA